MSFANIPKAQKLLELKRYSEAKKLLQDSHPYDIGTGEVFYLLARCEHGLGNKKEAQQALDQSLQINPNHAGAHYLQSILDYKAEKWAASESAVRRALELKPQNPDCLSQLANIQLARNQMAEAEKTIELGLSIDPNHVDLLHNKSRLYPLKNQGAEALHSLKQGLRNDPHNAYLLTSYGYRLLDKGEYLEAQQAFASALSNSPGNESARQGLAETYKVRFAIFRMFYTYGFSRYYLKPAWWQIIVLLVLIKTVLFWGGLFVLFLLFTWWGDVLFNSCLRLGRTSRYLLSEEKLQQSNFFLVANGVVIVSAIVASGTGSALWLKITLVCLLAMFIGIAFLEVDYKRQKISVGIAGAFALLVVLAALPFVEEITFFIAIILLALIVFGMLFSFRAIGWKS